MKRILIADDHPVVREALRLAAQANWPKWQVDEVADLAGLEATVSSRSGYQLVVLDLSLPDVKGLSGLLLVRKLLADVAILIVSARTDSQTIASTNLLGAQAFIDKSAPLSLIAEVMRRVVAGDIVFPQHSPTARGAKPEVADASRRLAALSAAQMRVLLALAGGRLNKQIADDMNLTEATVKTHLTAIFKKLGVSNRTQAVLAASPLLQFDGRTL